MSSSRLVIAICAGTAFACAEPTAPPAVGDRWILVSINGVALPAKPPGAFGNYAVLADTLEFGVTSSMWKPRPLARARRLVRLDDGTLLTEEWWYTYTESEPMPPSFAIRLLCADGDQTSIASCVDGNGQGSVDASSLTLRFNEPVFGVLRYVHRQ